MSEAQKLQDAESVKLVYKNCSQRCSTSCKLSPKELLALNTLRSQSRLEFNKANQSHQSLLSQFYETVFPNEDLPINNQSENWKKIGFQNKDPGSDFRGAGVFGLEQLLYLSTTYPKEFREIIENSSTYSFAISALNITHLLMSFFQLHKKTVVGVPGSKILHIGLLKTFCVLNLQSLETIHELFSAAVVKMHKIWMEMNKKGNLNLMQFQPAIRQAGEFVEKVLESNPKDLMELRGKLFYE